MSNFILGVIFGGIVVGLTMKLLSPQYRLLNSEEYRIAFNTMVTRLGRLQLVYTGAYQVPPKFNADEFREAHDEFNVAIDGMLVELGRIHGNR